MIAVGLHDRVQSDFCAGATEGVATGAANVNQVDSGSDGRAAEHRGRAGTARPVNDVIQEFVGAAAVVNEDQVPAILGAAPGLGLSQRAMNEIEVVAAILAAHQIIANTIAEDYGISEVESHPITVAGEEQPITGSWSQR